jgi:hypothetical protein
MYKSADALPANAASAVAMRSGRKNDLRELLWRRDIVHSSGNEKTVLFVHIWRL